MKILIVGAGIAGLSLGFELLNRGAEVEVLEARNVASGASGAATSYMEPRLGSTPIRTVEWEALRRWPDFVAAVEEASGTEIGFREDGQIRVAHETMLTKFETDISLRKEQGWLFERLTPQQVLAEEPALSGDIAAGLFLPQVRWVDGRKTCSALAAALVAGGAAVKTGFQVSEIKRSGSTMTARSAQGDMTTGDTVVLCTGTGLSIAGAPRDMPVTRPVRGVNLVLDMAGMPNPLRHIVKHHRGNFCPRDGNRLIVGTTYDRDETSLLANDAVLERLYANAEPVLPTVRDLPVLDVWCGLRPKVGDGRLFVGQSSHMPNVYFSLGHAGAGYLRAPVVAHDLSDWILGTGDGGLLKQMLVA